jgi:hypothetical protein
MTGLLKNIMLPLTTTIYFIEASLSDTVAAYTNYERYRKLKYILKCVKGTTEENLKLLEPMYNRVEPKVLFVETASDWTAYFKRSYWPSGNAFNSLSVEIFSDRLKCRGVTATCAGDVFIDNDGNITVDYDNVVFIYSDGRSDQKRSIWLTREDQRWSFETYGNPLKFEKVDKYKEKRTRDKFTPQMLEEYCAALGIHLFDENFYGSHGILLEFYYSKFTKMFEKAFGIYHEETVTEWQQKHIKKLK